MCCNWLQYRHKETTARFVSQRYTDFALSVCFNFQRLHIYMFCCLVAFRLPSFSVLVLVLCFHSLFFSVYHFALFLRFHNTKAETHMQRSKILCRFNAVCCGDSLNTVNTFYLSHIENLNCQCNNLLCNHTTNLSMPCRILLNTLQIYTRFPNTQLFFRILTFFNTIQSDNMLKMNKIKE